MNADIITAIVNGAILSAGMALGIAVLFRIWGRRFWNASTRYAVWFVALLVTIGLPLLYTPIRSVPFAGQDREQLPDPAGTRAPEGSPSLLRNGRGGDAATAPASGGANSINRAFAPIEVTTGAWTIWLVRAWFLASGAMLLRLLISYVMLHQRKSRAWSASGFGAARARQWLRRCGSTRAVRIAVSDEVAAPVAAGPFRPCIMIPGQLLHRLQGEELDQIGLHEAAHFARGDDYGLIFQRICEALFVFHPVVRWIARRLDLEREIACDDFVVELTGRAHAYAECLTRVVELTHGYSSPLAAPATAARSVLLRRVDMLLDRKGKAGTRVLKPALAILVAGLATALWLAAPYRQFVLFATASPFNFSQLIVASTEMPLHPIRVTGIAAPAPVAVAEVPQEPSFALVIVLDKSGSMGGGPAKIEMARKATELALDLIKDDQSFGVIAFNFNFDWVVPLQPAKDKAAMRRAIDGIMAAGETDMYPPLRAAYDALAGLPVRTRHVILLSDGRSLPPGSGAAQFSKDTITLSTVALGTGADRKTLNSLSVDGGGRSYYVEDPAELPDILARETGIAQQQQRAHDVAAISGAFEFASVKPAEAAGGGYLNTCHGSDSAYSADDMDQLIIPPAGQCRFFKQTLAALVASAYDVFRSNDLTAHVPFRLLNEIVVGAPPDQFFDIDAKAGRDTTEAQLYRMLQVLLSERFHLKLHREIREVPGYALVVTKNGPRFKEASNDEIAFDSGPLLRGPEWGGPVTGHGVAVPVLARTLATALGRPILNKTSLGGKYDIVLTWRPDEEEILMEGQAAPYTNAGSPPLRKAVEEQLGLRLRRQMVPVEVFVIDSAERPLRK